MFIGHAPAGYLITTAILKYTDRLPESRRKILICWGILASILPDFDLFYFYLIDNRQHVHHSYWTHIPMVWITITMFTMIYAALIKKRVIFLFTVIAFINIMGHLFLDTIVGGIRWLYPYTHKEYFMFHVPSQYNWWVWNFIFHWTFMLEMGVVTYTFYLYGKTHRC